MPLKVIECFVPLDAPTNCAGLRRVIAGVSADDAGRFLQYDGQELPW